MDDALRVGVSRSSKGDRRATAAVCAEEEDPDAIGFAGVNGVSRRCGDRPEAGAGEVGPAGRWRGSAPPAPGEVGLAQQRRGRASPAAGGADPRQRLARLGLAGAWRVFAAISNHVIFPTDFLVISTLSCM
ncbi:hypothetical protein NL676_006908 [Syzygium grande]|nr:hypothetical protein NL676_006908 [Syzygium grande]